MKMKLLKTGRNILLLMLFSWIAGTTSGQGYIDPNTLLIYGQVLNRNNGAPVPDQNVFLESNAEYNPNFIYSEKLVTDEKGFFYDTIETMQHKGSLDVFTFNEQNIITDTTVYFRFDWGENSSIVIDLYIDDSVTSNNFQANFSTIADTANSNMMKFFFTDNTITTGYDSIYWHWNFGDNHFSTQQNPDHQYQTPGVYKVTLTVTANFTPSGQVIQSTITKIVKATLNEYFNFGGHVFAEYFPIDMGIAYLYKIDEKNPVPIDTFHFDTLGYYYFYQLIEGKYTVKSDLDPGSSLFNLFMQTYYGDDIFWNQADTILLSNSNNWECDIHLIPVNENNSGQGEVGGTIVYTEEETLKGDPACNIQIYLLDDNYYPSYCTHSDENGLFNFENVVDGTYILFAELIGKTMIPFEITVSNNNPVINTIQVFIGIEDISGSILSIDPYVNNEFGINVLQDNHGNAPCFEITTHKAGLFTIRIIDLTGRPVFEDQKYIQDNYRFTMHESDLASGIYLLNIKSSFGQAIRKFSK